MFAVGLEGPVIPSEELRLEPKRAPLRHVATDGLDSDSRLTTTTSLESPLQGDLIHSSAYGGCDWILVNQSLVRLHWRQHWRQHWLWKTHCTTEEMVNQGTMTSMIISGSVQVITIHIIYNYIYITIYIYILLIRVKGTWVPSYPQHIRFPVFQGITSIHIWIVPDRPDQFLLVRVRHDSKTSIQLGCGSFSMTPSGSN